MWGHGCKGILDEAVENSVEGCCSVGARIEDEDEARLVVANAALLGPDRFAHHDVALREGVLGSGDPVNTRIVAGACIFSNPRGFPGGEGCALHLGALDHGESPVDWKPSVCWRLPLAVDWHDNGDGRTTATVRRWTRQDWGPEGQDMAWWCVEESEANRDTTPLWLRINEEIEALVGSEVAVELTRRLDTGRDGRPGMD